MRSIWKYELPMSVEPVRVSLPKGAKFLTLQMQGDSPCMWFEVDPCAVIERNRAFYLVGTGHELPDILSNYLGTFQIRACVFHAYEVDRECH